jgi:hypothetical protein
MTQHGYPSREVAGFVLIAFWIGFVVAMLLIGFGVFAPSFR